MAVLFKKIKDRYPDVARELEKADFRSDDEIRTLTRDDLHELLIGPAKLKQRKAVYELIHQQKPIGELLKDLKAFIPAESLTAALTENGVLSGYLQIMKDLTSQVEKVLSFFQAHVCLLEEHSNDYKAAKVVCTGSNAQQGSNLPPIPKGTHIGSNVQQGASAATGYRNGIISLLGAVGLGQTYAGPSPSSPESSQSDGFDHISDIDPAPHPSNVDPDEPPRAHEAQPVAEVSSSVATQQIRMTEKLPTVKFLSIVSGKTLNCENTLLDRLRNQGKVALVETQDSPQLIIVFCPITSRIDSDLKSVMDKRPESLFDKPVILVMMHHTYEPNEGVIQKPGSVLKKWDIVLVVNVFFHETMHGLLHCSMNNQAVTEMHATLLKHCVSESICESVNNGTSAKLDTCSDNSSASESLVRAGNYKIGDVALVADDCNAGTSSNSFYGSHDNQGGRVHRVDSCPSGNVYNAGTLYSRSSGTGGNDHNAGKVDKGIRASVKKSLFGWR